MIYAIAIFVDNDHYGMSPWSPFIFTACEHHLQTAQKLLVKLQAMITNGNSGLLSCLPHINATLMKLVYTCDGASKMETVTTSFEVKENIAPGKKMDLQPRFTATTNTPGRKQRNMLQYVNCFLFLAYIILLHPNYCGMYLTNSF